MLAPLELIFQAVFERINDEFHRRRDASAEFDSPLARLRAGIRVFLEMCTEDEFARIALTDGPKFVPGQAERGSSYALMRTQLEEATAAGEAEALNPELLAMALYGAIRSAGEFVISAPDRNRAAAEAVRAIDLLLDGLSRA